VSINSDVLKRSTNLFQAIIVLLIKLFS